MAQHPPDGRGDVASCQPSGRNLVQQRLKDVVIRSIDERDANGRGAKPTGGARTAESAAKDDDVGP
jgi:hypothetical protein